MKNNSPRNIRGYTDIFTVYDGVVHLEAFEFDKSRDEAFLELGGRPDGRQRSPVELAACQLAEVQRPRRFRQRVGERVDGRLARLLAAPRFNARRRRRRRRRRRTGDLLSFADADALRSPGTCSVDL